MTTATRCAAIGVACLAVVFSSCAPKRVHDPSGDPVDVLMITVDTFRADRAGCMGNPEGLTPYLDRLIRGGRLARRAFAPIPLTAPSHASLLTGLEPPSHGVRENGTFTLNDSIPRFPEALRRKGFRTGAFVGSFPLESRFGFAVGFDEFDDDIGPPGSDTSVYPERPARDVVDAALAWVSGLEPTARWFLWTHFFDAHQPRTIRRQLRRMKVSGDYEREIRQLDGEIGRLLRELTIAGGRAPLTIVVSDHGEGLGDHGEGTHGVLLHDPFLRALFAVVAPPDSPERDRLPPGIESRVVRHVDLLPTLADLVDFEIPENAEGVSLFESATDLGAFGESYYATLHYGWSPVWSWRDERWTYLESTKARLFDRATDPAEKNDVAAQHPEIVARLAARVAPWVREPTAGEPDVDAEARDKLAALGYLSGGATVRPNRTMDPIDEIDSIERLLGGMTLLGQGNALAALPLLERAYAADSNNVSAVFSLADCLRLVGRPTAAARHYRRTLELNPKIAEAWAHLALLTLESGDVDEGRRLFRVGLEENPQAFPLLMAAGDVSLRAGELPRAEEFYERARDAEPRRPEPLVGHAQLAEARGIASEADSWWRRVLEVDPNNPAIPARIRAGTEK